MMNKRVVSAALLIICLITVAFSSVPGAASSTVAVEAKERKTVSFLTGGGYAASGQISGVGYTTTLYDATNGLPTSDAMFLLGDSNGYVWIGGYSGVIRYDGSTFEMLDSSMGLTSARAFFEDSKERIWVGTNDNGVVLLDGENRTQFSYKDGLTSSSIRIFSEDRQGNVFIGTTAGVAYVDPDGLLRPISNEKLDTERVLKLDRDIAGRIFGQTSGGLLFAIDNCKISELYTSAELGFDKITTILADPSFPGKIYIGTSSGDVYYGSFGDRAGDMKKIPALEASVHWLSYDCGRIWVSSTKDIGYIDEYDAFHLLTNTPLEGGIEMTTSDYQGNLWIASSTQGVLKVVTNNFVDLTENAGYEEAVTNAVCIHNEIIYYGTDSGLRAVDKYGRPYHDGFTQFIGDARVRCIFEDRDGQLWVSTYNKGLGLVCRTNTGAIYNYTVDSGMPSNEIRAVIQSSSGAILAATNGGLAEIRYGSVVRVVSGGDVIKNTVFLTIAEDAETGKIYAGTDGDGIYVIDGGNITRLGRDEGLTSDVIMRIKWDDFRQVFWIVTSNSIEYLKDGKITDVASFPYKNNYDLYFNRSGEMWILSSYGVYRVDADEMIEDKVENYRLYTIANGLPYSITSNSYSAYDSDGSLYIAARKGVIRLNIDSYFEETSGIETALNRLYIDDELIRPDKDGVYRLPASRGRVSIMPSVMDYTNTNPQIRVYLEGSDDPGKIVSRENLSALEYTDLPYGNYTLHVAVLSSNGKQVISDSTYKISKKARLTEMKVVRVLMFVLIPLAVGFLVWRFMKATVVSRQYETIRQAKDEAERANTAKSRFLANMSHEIRTPINTIMGMNEMVMREDATGVPKSYFMSMMNYAFDIRNASESLLGLINDLLDMSKIESGKMHLVEQEYDIQDMLRSAASMIRVRSTQKELTFDVVVDEILPKRLFGDDGKIKQIILNLLTNAVKYTRIGGFCLSVSMTERKDDICKLRFSVKDTGIGVKPEDIDKLFTAYERLDEEQNSGIQGTGLGLDISRRFAQLMGGDLTCESTYGEGSEFILTLDQRIVDAAPIGIFTEHDESTAKGPYIPQFVAPDADILVVDDNPMNLNIFRGLLKATRVFVTTAESGEECLELLENSKFNVIFLDHMMPGMDGIETLAHIRERDKDIPVYALTANASAGAEFYKSKGFNGYLSKPIDTLTLEKTIMQHLPEEMMEKPSEDAAIEELTELPENMLWIRETEGICADDGITNSGGIMNYIFALKLFRETIDDNSRVLNDALESDNIRLYTIKVHALKSSARIIGANALSQQALDLENAGNSGDKDFIIGHADELMKDYLAFKEKLARLEESEEDGGGEDKEPISEQELKDAYEALREEIPQMDYDAVEMILDQLAEYKLSPEDDKFYKELRHKLKVFDWDSLEELIKQKG